MTEQMIVRKKYKKIEFSCGQTIESAVNELKKHKKLVCGDFNGQTIYSDVDDIDSAYKKVTGKTKSEFDAEWQKKYEEYELKEKQHKEAMPQLTKEWIEKGKIILDEKYIELWIKCVTIRLGDLYHGMELGCCLDIVKELNSGCELQKAKEMIEEQGHSGMSFGLVCSMVKSFSDRGVEFVRFART